MITSICVSEIGHGRRNFSPKFCPQLDLLLIKARRSGVRLKKKAPANLRNSLASPKTRIIARMIRESHSGRRRANKSITSLKLSVKPAAETWKALKSGRNTAQVITPSFSKTPMGISWKFAVAEAQPLRTDADRGNITGVSPDRRSQNSAAAKPRPLSQADRPLQDREGRSSSRDRRLDSFFEFAGSLDG